MVNAETEASIATRLKEGVDGRPFCLDGKRSDDSDIAILGPNGYGPRFEPHLSADLSEISSPLLPQHVQHHSMGANSHEDQQSQWTQCIF